MVSLVESCWDTMQVFFRFKFAPKQRSSLSQLHLPPYFLFLEKNTVERQEEGEEGDGGGERERKSQERLLHCFSF